MRRTALVLPRSPASRARCGSAHFNVRSARMSRCSMRTAKRRPSRCLAPPLPAFPMYRSTTGSPTPILPHCCSASHPPASSAMWSASSGSALTPATGAGARRLRRRRGGVANLSRARTNLPRRSPSSFSPAARPPRRRPRCCATRICSPTSWARVEFGVGFHGGSGAGLRAALSHCRNRGAAELYLRHAAHRTAAGLRP